MTATKWLTITALLACTGTAQAGESIWDHNGSLMRLSTNGPGLVVSYLVTRPGLTESIGPGTVRFQGQRIGDEIVGTAFVYSVICPPTPYPVRGVVYNESIELRGAAPLLDPDTCAVLAYIWSGNARLVFTYVQTPRAQAMGRDEERESLLAQGRAFCSRYPSDSVCPKGQR